MITTPIRATVWHTMTGRHDSQEMTFPTAEEFLTWIAKQEYEVVLVGPVNENDTWSVEIYDSFRE